MIIPGIVKTGQKVEMYGWQKQTDNGAGTQSDIKLLYCRGLSLPERQKVDTLNFHVISQVSLFLIEPHERFSR
jgi:hypothetical protein